MIFMLQRFENGWAARNAFTDQDGSIGGREGKVSEMDC
jgi:hypothetical protein